MDSINDIIASLSDEDMKQLKSIADEVMKDGSNRKENSSDGIDMNMLLKAKDIMNRMNNASNKNTQLILALKPHLSEKSREKADNAAKMLKLFEILPYIKDLF